MSSLEKVIWLKKKKGLRYDALMQMFNAKFRFPFIVRYVFFLLGFAPYLSQKTFRQGETIQNLLVARFLGKQHSALCEYCNQ